MQITYPGPFEAVTVAACGLVDVKRGATVDVPDDVAAQLLEQGWLAPAELPDTVDGVKDWVSEDPATRAPIALAAEKAGKDRKTLVEWLSGLLDNDTAPAENEGA